MTVQSSTSIGQQLLSLGWRNVAFFGSVHALALLSHILWILYPSAEFFATETYRKYAPDLARDRFYTWLDRYFILLQLPLESN